MLFEELSWVSWFWFWAGLSLTLCGVGLMSLWQRGAGNFFWAGSVFVSVLGVSLVNYSGVLADAS